MKTRKLVETTELRKVKVQKWIETEAACAGPQCRYPDARHYAKGMCQHCYLANRMRTQRSNGDTIETVQAELSAVPLDSRLPKGLYDRMKKLGLENFDTKPKAQAPASCDTIDKSDKPV